MVAMGQPLNDILLYVATRATYTGHKEAPLRGNVYPNFPPHLKKIQYNSSEIKSKSESKYNVV